MKYLVLESSVELGRDFNGEHAASWKVRRGTSEPELRLKQYDGRESDGGLLRADPKHAAVLDAEAVLGLISPVAKSAVADGEDPGFMAAGMHRMPVGLTAIKAHTSRFTGQGVTVAVLDTGIDVTHPAFEGKDIARRNFTQDGASDDVTDNVGHGTHCAGTICGRPVGDVRVGVAPGVTKLCVGKVLSGLGGTLEMVLSGMFWAVLEQNASVVSMSLGYDITGNTARLIERGYDPKQAIQAATRAQTDIAKGVSLLRAFLESRMGSLVMVAASGNESQRPAFPALDASLPASELFAVGAVGPTPGGNRWSLASFSNGRVQVVAPGVDVISAAVGGGWATMSGTSMATPHVAGVAALLVEQATAAGNLAVPEVVRSALRAGATRELLVEQDVSSVGVGMVQAPQ